MNHKPQIWGTDWAIWRRILLVPWTVVIPPGEQDRGLKQKLVAELPGVLSWLVEGCLKWQEKGLDPPPEVLEASARYREEMDALADFLASCCVLSPSAEVAAKDLYEAYEEWCKQDAQKAFSKKTFGLKLGERGFSSRLGGGGRRLWRGLRLLNPGETPPEPPRTVTCGDARNPYVTECVTPVTPDFSVIHAEGDLTVASSPNFSLASSRVGLSGTHVTTPHTSPESPANDVRDTSYENLTQDGGLPVVSAEVTSLTSPEDGPCAGCRARADRPGYEGWWCFRAALFEGKSGKPTRITEDLGAGCPHRQEGR